MKQTATPSHLPWPLFRASARRNGAAQLAGPATVAARGFCFLWSFQTMYSLRLLRRP